MRKAFVLLLVFCSLRAYNQLAVTLLVPPGGMFDKQQLWNVLISNTAASAMNLRVQVVLTEVSSGEPVLSATTGLITVAPGTRQLSAATVGAVQYNSLSSQYRVDPGPAGLLPVGMFNACYNFQADNGKTVVQECQQVSIDPLSPLQLNLPSDGAVLESVHPTFNWLPLSSAQSLNNLTYTLTLVEMYSGQSAADALAKNVPLYTGSNLTATQLFYAPNAPALEVKKHYAWQVKALNNFREITKSEAQQFTVADPSSGTQKLASNPVYIKLKKEGQEEGQATFYGHLRFAYLNETADTLWSLQLTDISAPARRRLRSEALDTLRLIRGENLVDLPGRSIKGLQDGHLYLLQHHNSRGEIWQLRFVYRKEKQQP